MSNQQILLSVANDSDMTAVERRNKIEGGDETCMTGMNIRIVCPVQRERKEEEAMAHNSPGA